MEETCQNCVQGVKDRAICSECNGTTVVAQTVASVENNSVPNVSAEDIPAIVSETPVEQIDAVAERE